MKIFNLSIFEYMENFKYRQLFKIDDQTYTVNSVRERGEKIYLENISNPDDAPVYHLKDFQRYLKDGTIEPKLPGANKDRAIVKVDFSKLNNAKLKL